MKHVSILLVLLLCLLGVTRSIPATDPGPTVVVPWATTTVDLDGECVGAPYITEFGSISDACSGASAQQFHQHTLARSIVVTEGTAHVGYTGSAGYDCSVVLQTGVTPSAHADWIPIYVDGLDGTLHSQPQPNIFLPAGTTLTMRVDSGGAGCAGATDPTLRVSLLGYEVDDQWEATRRLPPSTQLRSYQWARTTQNNNNADCHLHREHTGNYWHQVCNGANGTKVWFRDTFTITGLIAAVSYPSTSPWQCDYGLRVNNVAVGTILNLPTDPAAGTIHYQAQPNIVVTPSDYLEVRDEAIGTGCRNGAGPHPDNQLTVLGY